MAKKTNVKINGKEYYRLRVTIGKDKDGEPIVKPFYGVSKRDAENKLDEWKKDRAQGLKIDADQSLTMAMYKWLWNIERVSGNKSKTFERYEGTYRNYVESSDIGYVMSNEIEKFTLQAHYNKLYNSGYSYSQLKNLNKLLSKFFTYCVQEKILLHNPCKGIKFDAYKEDEQLIEEDIELNEEGKVETFFDDEIELINTIPNQKLRIIARFALGTGLRQGEILALRLSDIKDMTVAVTKTLSYVKIYDDGPAESHYEYRVTRPKTKNSRRRVPIPSKLKSDLVELNKIRNVEKLKLGELYIENDLLFPSSTGSYIDGSNLLQSWKRALERINVPYKKFHSLRHTYATQLLKRGTEITVVSRLLGHASIKTTEIYVHVLESTKQEKVEALNALL